MKTIITIIIALLLVIFFWPKEYISSPGFVTPEGMAAFENNAEKCIGFSYLTNADEVAADAPGKSLCYGWLVG